MPRRLDVTMCLPAVFDVHNSTKKKEVESFCIPTAKVQKALLEYIEYIRPHGPSKPSAETLFISAKGKALDTNGIAYFLKCLGKAVNVQDLTVSALRGLIETEGALTTSEAAKNISAHLGHLEQTAQDYYITTDKRHTIEATFAVLSIIEDVGELDEIPKTLWDPVSMP